MSSSEQYKRQIMNDLAQGDVESLEDAEAGARIRKLWWFCPALIDERRQLFCRSFHPDRIPTEQMEPELQHAISKLSLMNAMMLRHSNQLKKEDWAIAI